MMKVSRIDHTTVKQGLDSDGNFLTQEEALLKQDIKTLIEDENEDSSSVDAAERVWKRLQQLVKADK